MLIGFEHIGMTSADLDRTIAFYCGLLGLRLVLRKRQANGGEVAFLDAGGGMLEVSCPPGPIESARTVPSEEAGLRHITLAFSDIDAVRDRLTAEGFTMTEAPRLAFNSEILKRVAFCLDPDGIVVELAERQDR
jgi:glyoxylase I family protein